jgi:TfuA protein
VTRRRPVVFAGASLEAADIRAGFDVELCPPAGYGDLDALLAREQPPAAIGIIDGVVAPIRSVQPKEVLAALDRGIPVFGAAGIGALRAVECGRYGMVGVGRIFEEYRSGRLDADDEVLRADHPPSEPLVNMRFAVASAVSAGAATAGTARRFLDVAKDLYYPQRTVEAVLRTLATEIGAAECAALREYLTVEAPDTAREDALALLDAMTKT